MAQFTYNLFLLKLAPVALPQHAPQSVADLHWIARDARPPGPKISLFSYRFLGKIGQIIGWHPPSGVGAPPQGNPGSATASGCHTHWLHRPAETYFCQGNTCTSHTDTRTKGLYKNQQGRRTKATRMGLGENEHFVSIGLSIILCWRDCISNLFSVSVGCRNG